MRREEVIEYQTPDKSEALRYGFMNLMKGYDHSLKYVESLETPSDDIRYMYLGSIDWNSGNDVRVGESGTWFRFLQFADWKYGLGKKFIKEGSLINREIINDPSIVNKKLKDLLELDNKTSQWASAAVMLGNKEKVYTPPFKLALTYECMKKWEDDPKVEPEIDVNIYDQSLALYDINYGKENNFIPKQAEDYCFARAHDMITPKEGLKRWKQLTTQESNRIKSMEDELYNLENNRPIKSKDHRVVMAVAGLAKVKKIDAKIENPKAVNKSYPGFWKFLENM